MLIQKFANEKENFIIRLILDPTFKSEFEFIKNLSDSFGIESSSRSSFEYKNDLQNYLLQKGAGEKKVVPIVLLARLQVTLKKIEGLIGTGALVLSPERVVVEMRDQMSPGGLCFHMGSNGWCD